jgi:hypothetical protein
MKRYSKNICGPAIVAKFQSLFRKHPSIIGMKSHDPLKNPHPLDHHIIRLRSDCWEVDRKECAMSNIIHLAGRFSPPPSTLGCTVPRQGNDRAPIYRASPRGDANSSVPSREELRLWGLAAEKLTPHSFSSRAAWAWNVVLEISKSFTFFLICLFGGLVITGAALSPFIYLSFFRLH